MTKSRNFGNLSTFIIIIIFYVEMKLFALKSHTINKQADADVSGSLQIPW